MVLYHVSKVACGHVAAQPRLSWPLTWTHNEGSALLGWVALEIEEWSRHCPPQAPEAAREEAGLDVGALA